MRYTIGTIFIIALLVAALFWRSTTNAPTSVTTLPGSTIVLDVRTAEEYAMSHVPDARLFPLQDLQAGKLPEESKDTLIAVYCRSGNRSSQAATILRDAGFTHVTDMGGLSDVEKYGYKVVSTQ